MFKKNSIRLCTTRSADCFGVITFAGTLILLFVCFPLFLFDPENYCALFSVVFTLSFKMLETVTNNPVY